MDKQTVLFKTDAGREALTSRPAGLGPRLRSLLIMVDGKRTVADLDKLLGSEGAAEALLTQLIDQGWVESNAAVVPAAPPVLTAVVAEPVAAPVADALPFPDARRLVVRFINDQLGPMGEPLAIKVEGCKGVAELLALLPRIRDGLRNFKNSATVAQFDQDVVPRLPSA
jgi:hypothetical protein